MLLLTVVVVVAVAVVVVAAADEPFDVARHLNTKTPYTSRASAPRAAPPASLQCQGSEGTSPVHVEQVARHGTRYPTSGDVGKLAKLATLLHEHADEITAPGFEWMRTWESPFSPEVAGLLAPPGAVQHYLTAQRWRNESRYDDVLSAPYRSWTFPILTTAVMRAARSGNAFGYGLFGESMAAATASLRGESPSQSGSADLGPDDFDPFFQWSRSPNEDTELRFFANCPTYTTQVSDSVRPKSESNRFAAEHGAAMAADVASALGLSAGNATWLTYSVAKVMFKACAFEVALHNKTTGGFCDAFSQQTVLDFEFGDDLSTYYVKGWGTPLSYEIACPLLQSIFDGLDVAAAGSEMSPRVNLRFAHAETILPFAARLGLFRDAKPLTADMTSEEREARLWRSSVISDFAANFQFNLYNCSGTPVVELMHNEMQVNWPSDFQDAGCPPNSAFCPLAALREAYAEPLACDFSKLCGTANAPMAPPSSPPATDNKAPAGPMIGTALAIGLVVLALAVGAVAGAAGLITFQRRQAQKAATRGVRGPGAARGAGYARLERTD